jgi:pSer/pThr/pTyr-binding forkhead associated (FHA) protein
MEPGTTGHEVVGVPTIVRLSSSRARAPIPLTELVTIIGTKRGVAIRLKSRSISGAHAALINIENTVYVRDLSSRTGVFVNDKQVRESRLFHGDVLRVGGCRYRFSDLAVLRRSRDNVRPMAAVLSVGGIASPVALTARTTVIGRREDADLVLTGDQVSIAHAIILEVGTRRVLCDLHSRYGTTVNGERITAHSLVTGDTIQIGGIELVYVSDPAAISTLEDSDIPSSGLLSDLKHIGPGSLQDSSDDTAQPGLDDTAYPAAPSQSGNGDDSSEDSRHLILRNARPLAIDFSRADALPASLFAESNVDLPLLYRDDDAQQRTPANRGTEATGSGAPATVAPIVRRRGKRRLLLMVLLLFVVLAVAATAAILIKIPSLRYRFW